MTIVIVQCRLSSTRLPQKALLPLGGKPLVRWTLDAMKKVPAHKYILAVDYDSEALLAPIAHDAGWDIFAGPKEDVLERFCAAAVSVGCCLPTDYIVRATADNPFLFYEAAISLLKEMEKMPSDYITYSNMPHGSGVEMFNARSLIEASGMTTSAYDHEHVGPAFYNHPQHFASVMIPAPERWRHPDLRTTVDTETDYRRSLRIVSYLTKQNKKTPYTAEEICSAFTADCVAHPILCVPSVVKGHGTGHIRRCLDIACKTQADIFISKDCSLDETWDLIEKAKNQGLEEWQIINTIPLDNNGVEEKKEYSLIVTDYFMLNKELAERLSSLAPVVSIDEGSEWSSCCDYLLDIIPSPQLLRTPNYRNSNLIPLPHKRRTPLYTPGKKTDKIVFSKILISAGGEDPAGLSVPTAVAFAQLGKKTTILVSNPELIENKIPQQYNDYITVLPSVSNLREELYKYDLVVTHYGFTAYEALATGCGVLLLGTSDIHISLAEKTGFALLTQDTINSAVIEHVLMNPECLFPSQDKDAIPVSKATKEDVKPDNLPDFIVDLSKGRRIACPVCNNREFKFHQIAARTPDRTYRRCAHCGMLYMSWSLDKIKPSYDNSYFFKDYEKQYGKTYLEDFSAIKEQCVRRMSIIDSLFWVKNKNSQAKKHSGVNPSVLDIGCAFGPFLDAGVDAGWQVFGTDISKEAVDYVQNKLKYPAVWAQFPDFDSGKELGMVYFDCVTMWYVIEHFKDLQPVLHGVSKMLKVGGIFAFSTPSAGGVSAKYSREKFFAESPADHYTLWEPASVKEIMKKFGFKVVKTVSTGHHPERFPVNWKGNHPFSHSLLTGFSKTFGLGDTFEVYCIKTEDRF